MEKIIFIVHRLYLNFFSLQVDAFESLEELRHPGRVLHIHEKLSSPSRKRSLSEKMRRHEEKIAKAQELRENLMLAKTEKLKDLFKKVIMSLYIEFHIFV